MSPHDFHHQIEGRAAAKRARPRELEQRQRRKKHEDGPRQHLHIGNGFGIGVQAKQEVEKTFYLEFKGAGPSVLAASTVAAGRHVMPRLPWLSLSGAAVAPTFSACFVFVP